jgi:hypothetical protein
VLIQTDTLFFEVKGVLHRLKYMKTILTLLIALFAFTAAPTTQAKADLFTTGSAAVSQSTLGHRYYGDRPYWRGGYRHHYRGGNYYRGYRNHYYRGYRHYGHRSGVTIRF